MIRENSAVRGKRKIAKCSQIADTPSESTVVTTIHGKSAEYFVCLSGSNSGPDSFALVSNNYFSWRSAIPALSAFTGYIRGLPQRRTAAVGMNVNSEAAKFAFPDRVAIALFGDGAMLMNGVNELVTIAHYWREWSDPRLIVMVLANRDLN